jgi:phosphoglycolate phosphatase
VTTVADGPTVGFDLDMTLIDSRPGIGAVYHELAREQGVVIDVDLVVSRLGPPLNDELAQWFPAERVPALADRFRELYPRYAIEPTRLMPGAAEAVAAVHAAGGRVVVITAKYAPNARLHLTHCGLAVDELVGWAWADGKRDALREHRAVAYVGDHTADMAAAKAAPVTAVGVATGPCDQHELRAAGAEVVLPNLDVFPAWFASTKLFGHRLNSR